MIQTFSLRRQNADSVALGAVLCAALVLGSLGPAESTAAPVLGVAAPDFALKTFGNENLRLSEFRGDVVIVSFWATWCGSCQQELPRLNDLHERYRRAGLVLLGVNVDDDIDRAKSMAARLAVSFPMLLDRQKDVARLYQLEEMPMTVFIDREGVVRFVQETFRAGDEAVYLERIRRLLDE